MAAPMVRSLILSVYSLSIVNCAHFQPQSILSKFLEGIPADFLRGSASTTAGPALAPQFTASVSIEIQMSDSGLPFGNASGVLVYDATVEKYWMDTDSRLPQFGPMGWNNQTSLAYGMGASAGFYQVSNGQCMHLDGVYAQGGFAGLFSWLAVANKTGQDSVDGRVCERWSYTPPPPYEKYTMAACLDGDEPVYLERSAPGRSRYIFGNLTRSVDKSKFQTPAACNATTKTCGSGKIVRKSIYVAHPDGNYNISGQDVADLKGDAVFMCTDQIMWTLGKYTLLSQFELSIVDTFSQYTNYPPPGNHGFGGDGFHVGRETPIGIGRHGGQCEDDADMWQSLGVWYSLPAGGQCRSENEHLGVDCTWRIERRVNTIEIECLLHQQGMLAMCNKTVAPFDDVTNVLLKSLASEDVAKGGCESVKAPMCKVHPACAHLNGDCCPHQDGTYLDCCSQQADSHTAVIV